MAMTPGAAFLSASSPLGYVVGAQHQVAGTHAIPYTAMPSAAQPPEPSGASLIGSSAVGAAAASAAMALAGQRKLRRQRQQQRAQKSKMPRGPLRTFLLTGKDKSAAGASKPASSDGPAIAPAEGVLAKDGQGRHRFKTDKAPEPVAAVATAPKPEAPAPAPSAGGVLTEDEQGRTRFKAADAPAGGASPAASAAAPAPAPSAGGVLTKDEQGRARFKAAAASASKAAGGYCDSVEKMVRRSTRTVTIGRVKVGSDHPIATQTMTTTLTEDVEGTVAQIKKCADMGIDIVRVTVQGMTQAKACEHIRKRLDEDGYHTPIVADIHFTPKVALKCAEYVDKVRVNPGNFADGRKSFGTIDTITDEDMKEAQDAIEESFVPLIMKLKERGAAMRIGVNHGSLSERILFQYGDSPEGMVASALEFAEICRKYDYHNFVFSMKSSNPQVMVQAYRALARKMYELGWDYPLHLGVTEAGGGADGRIKSAAGIGTLLMDGLGDTIRVSLTEDPEFEAKPCVSLRGVAENAEGKGVDAAFEEKNGRRDGVFSRRKCDFPLDVPLNADGSVLTAIGAQELASLNDADLCARFNLRLRADGDIQKDFKSVDVALVDGEATPEVAEKMKTLLNLPVGVLCRPGPNLPDGVTLLFDAEAASAGGKLPQLPLGGNALVFTGEESEEVIAKALQNAAPRLVLLRPESQDGVTFLGRRFFSRLASTKEGKDVPCMLWFRYPEVAGQDEDDFVIRASADFGSLFLDGYGEGMLWQADKLSAEYLIESSFNLLQASRMRISKTEFISCPSCGRTLFNLQEVTAKIQARTGHLPGVRVAIMGCIVNGPGEMADADFGYVGSGVGKIDLYVNYDCVKRGIPSENGVEKLIELIKEHGKWQDPPEEVESEEMAATAVMG